MVDQVWHYDSSGGFGDKGGAEAHVRIAHPVIMPRKPSAPSSKCGRESEKERREGHNRKNVKEIK